MYKKITPVPSLSVDEIAQMLGATVSGPGDTSIKGICSLDHSSEDCIAFFSGESQKKLTSILNEVSCAALFVRDTLDLPEKHTIPLLQVKNPQEALLTLLGSFYESIQFQSGISEKADVSEHASIGNNVSIGAFSVVAAEVQIGNNVTIHPHVVIYPGTIIEDNCIIHSGAIIREYCHLKKGCIIQNGTVIGSDGFGYVPDPSVGLRAVPQVGRAVLGPLVDVGANSCIDRGALGDTSINLGVKVDNLVQIGHNVSVGEHTIICGQSGIAGSTRIGTRCVLGGSTGVGDHLTISDNSRFGGNSGVITAIDAPGDYMGYPAIPASQWRRQEIAAKKLPKLVKDVQSLKKYLKESS